MGNAEPMRLSARFTMVHGNAMPHTTSLSKEHSSVVYPLALLLNSSLRHSVSFHLSALVATSTDQTVHERFNITVVLNQLIIMQASLLVNMAGDP